MKLNSGLFFGLTSGVITTLGLIIGLYFATASFKAVITGIITIAIADALSDALGIHISKDAENLPEDHVWLATISTFLSKLFVASSFLIPFLLFPLNIATIISLFWGLTILIIGNIIIAKIRKEKPIKLILEHLLIAIIVLAITFGIGKLLSIII